MAFVILPDCGFALDYLISWSRAGDNTVNFILRHEDGARADISACTLDVFVAAVRLARNEREQMR